MRKLMLAISVMALPLAACDQPEEKPVDPDPVEVIEEPMTETDGDPATTETDGMATDQSAMKPGMDEAQSEPAMPTEGEKAAE